jgi:hypothetical protein
MFAESRGFTATEGSTSEFVYVLPLPGSSQRANALTLDTVASRVSPWAGDELAEGEAAGDGDPADARAVVPGVSDAGGDGGDPDVEGDGVLPREPASAAAIRTIATATTTPTGASLGTHLNVTGIHLTRADRERDAQRSLLDRRSLGQHREPRGRS